MYWQFHAYFESILLIQIAQIVCEHWRQTNKIAYSLYKDSKNQGFSYNLQLLRKKKSNLQALCYPYTVNWILKCCMDLRKKEKDISPFVGISRGQFWKWIGTSRKLSHGDMRMLI